MRILLIHNNYGITSGEERMVKQIADLLLDRGHTVDCHFVDGLPPNAGWIAKGKAFLSGIYCPKSINKVIQRVRNFQPDIVQVQNLYPFLSPWILPVIRREGIPVIMRCANYRLLCPSGLFLSHGQVCERCAKGREYWCIIRNCETSIPKSIGYALRNFVARIFRLHHDNINFYYTLTNFQREKLVEGGLPAELIEVIPNMVDTSYAFNGKTLGMYVAFAGRGSPEKGILTLIDAARKSQSIPFSLAGDFWRMPMVKNQKPDNVELLGHLQGARMHDFYNNCRFLVFPSICYESFGLVVIEAMLHGKPVICSKIAGLSEIVDDGKNGLFFEPGNSNDLAAKIKWLWNRPELCKEMGKAGREKITQNFSPSRYYDRLIRLYYRAFDLKKQNSF